MLKRWQKLSLPYQIAIGLSIYSIFFYVLSYFLVKEGYFHDMFLHLATELVILALASCIIEPVLDRYNENRKKTEWMKVKQIFYKGAIDNIEGLIGETITFYGIYVDVGTQVKTREEFLIAYSKVRTKIYNRELQHKILDETKDITKEQLFNLQKIIASFNSEINNLTFSFNSQFEPLFFEKVALLSQKGKRLEDEIKIIIDSFGGVNEKAFRMGLGVSILRFLIALECVYRHCVKETHEKYALDI